jgi:activator of HSP90 ATPase
MNKVIEQTVKFENTTPEHLFDIFTDPEKHSEILGGAEVIISKKEGARFSCFDGNVTGKNLLVIPGKMIVQSWRGNVWGKNDPDSILTLVFSTIKTGAQIYMVHANTPEQFDERWNEFYWKPIKQYLKAGK